MDYKRLFFLITILLSCSSAFADYKKVITLSAGPAWSRGGDTQTLYLTPPQPQTIFRNRYNAENTTRTMGMAEIFLALQWPFTCFYNFNNQLGVAFGGSNEAKMQGTIDIDKPPSNSYVSSGSHYEYRTNHAWVSVRGKSALDPADYFIQPYITASVGAGFNKAYGFQTYPLINPSISSSWFEDNTASFVFTYSAGAGIQKNIGNWDLGFGYEFTDWGKSSLGRAITYPWTHDGPSLSHIYAHRLLFNLSYIFC